MSEVHHITEIIPDFDKLPDWAREAFEDGQYFAVVSEKVIEYEATIKAIGELKSYSVTFVDKETNLRITREVINADELQAIIKGN